MNNNSEKTIRSPFKFCSRCGGKMKFEQVQVRKINNGNFELTTATYRCESCDRQVKQDRITPLWR